MRVRVLEFRLVSSRCQAERAHCRAHPRRSDPLLGPRWPRTTCSRCSRSRGLCWSQAATQVGGMAQRRARQQMSSTASTKGAFNCLLVMLSNTTPPLTRQQKCAVSRSSTKSVVAITQDLLKLLLPMQCNTLDWCPWCDGVGLPSWKKHTHLLEPEKEPSCRKHHRLEEVNSVFLHSCRHLLKDLFTACEQKLNLAILIGLVTWKPLQ